jgi:hypothetical protein
MASRAELYQSRLIGFQRVINRPPASASTAHSSNSLPAQSQKIDYGDRIWWPIDVDLGDHDNPVDVDFWDYLSDPPPSPPRTASGRLKGESAITRSFGADITPRS